MKTFCNLQDLIIAANTLNKNSHNKISNINLEASRATFPPRLNSNDVSDIGETDVGGDNPRVGKYDRGAVTLVTLHDRQGTHARL